MIDDSYEELQGLRRAAKQWKQREADMTLSLIVLEGSARAYARMSENCADCVADEIKAVLDRWRIASRVALLLLLLLVPGRALAAPLIVLELADDLRPDDLRFLPSIDSIAAQSVRFSAALTTVPLCTPSRTMLLTGRLPDVTRVYDNDAGEFDPTWQTLGTKLQAAGYRTALVGKLLNRMRHLCQFTPNPTPAGDDVEDVADAHVEDACDGYLTRSIGGHPANLDNVRPVEFGATPASDIDHARNGLEMRGIDATRSAAQMVKLQAIGNQANEALVYPAMGRDDSPLRGVPSRSVAEPVRRALPDPTSAAGANDEIDTRLAATVSMEEAPGDAAMNRCGLPTAASTEIDEASHRGMVSSPAEVGQCRLPGWDTWFALQKHNDFGREQTPILTRHALKFIRECRRDQVPCFLYLAPVSPHGPLPGPAACDGRTFPDAPFPEYAHEWARRMSSICGLDAMTAAILAHLPVDAVFVFAGDNGFSVGEDGKFGKNQLTMDALSIPLVIRAPGVVPDTNRREVVTLVDLHATVLALAGAPIGADVDGQSMVPLLHGSTADWQGSVLIETHRGKS